MRKPIPISLLFTCFFYLQNACSQQLSSGSGTYIRVGNGTRLALHGLDFTNNGQINNLGKIVLDSGSLTNQGHFQNLDTLELAGDLTSGFNFFNFNPASVRFTGTSNSILHGELNAWQLVLDKTNASLSLDGPLFINGNLHFDAPDNHLFVNDWWLQLASDATVSGSGQEAFIVTNGTGPVIKSFFSGSFTFPTGFSASEFNPLTVVQNGDPDGISVRCTENQLGEGENGTPLASEGVDAAWAVSENIAGGSQLDLTVQWSATDELPAFNRNNCAVGKWDGAAWDFGTLVGSAASGSNPYSAGRSGLGGLGVFAVRSGTALPLELLDFQAIALNGQDAMLTWQTAHEVGVSHFEIERSIDGLGWATVGQTKSRGGATSEMVHYDFTDSGVARQRLSSPAVYYRLKMVDEDVWFQYSPVRSVEFPLGETQAWSVFPNPCPGFFYVKNMAPKHPESPVRLAVYAAAGQLMLETEWQEEAQDVRSWPTGIYRLGLYQDGRLVYANLLNINN